MRSTLTFLIQAPGPHYLAVRNLAGAEFYWTPERDLAFAVVGREDADLLMEAVRKLKPDLFGFALVLRDPRVVEA